MIESKSICNQCGKNKSEHKIDPYSGEPIKCPIYRQEDEQLARNM